MTVKNIINIEDAVYFGLLIFILNCAYQMIEINLRHSFILYLVTIFVGIVWLCQSGIYLKNNNNKKL